ncbi:MAG: hypothetical protein ABJH04_07425 [Cyclobacteriaceae bacterium]
MFSFFNKKKVVIETPENLEEAFANLRFLLRSEMVKWGDVHDYILNRLYSRAVGKNTQLDLSLTGKVPDSHQLWYLNRVVRFCVEGHGMPLPLNIYKFCINIGNLFLLPQYEVDTQLTKIGKEIQLARPADSYSLKVSPNQL